MSAVKQPSSAGFLLAGVTLFLSAVLMFVMQPLLGRQLLPLLGGSPVVWNVCMVFFQVLLLAGYALAHGLARGLPVRLQVAAVAGLFFIAWWTLPFAAGAQVTAELAGSAAPLAWLLRELSVVAALPALAVAVLSPLLQSWAARLTASAEQEPYQLYAMSNAGSLLGLVAYPLLLEPNLSLVAQAQGWRVGFVVLGVMVVAVGLLAAGSGGEERGRDARLVRRDACPTITWRERGRWVLLALAPAALLLGVTNYLATDIASVPLLWAVPLGLYLATFVIAFSTVGARWLGVADRVLPMLAVATVFLMLAEVRHPAWLLGGLNLAFFFAAALVCHCRLAATRPQAEHLTEFYLYLSVGGAVGGTLTALVAPVVFTGVVEYPLAMLLALGVRGQNSCRRLAAADLGAQQDEAASSNPPATRRLQAAGTGSGEGEEAAGFRLRSWVIAVGLGGGTALMAVLIPRFGLQPFQLWMVVMFGLPLLGAYLLARTPVAFALALGGVMLGGQLFTALHGQTLHRERNFFGTIRVALDPSGPFHALYHGTTIHGLQFVDPARRGEPLAYYHRNGPLGTVMRQAKASGLTRNIGVVGLGSGAMAAYASEGERWTFYEIDPAMARLAEAGREFTYLAGATNASVRVVVGDARLRLREAQDGEFGLLVLDAFGSDTVPVHLLTRQAFELYVRKLAPGGLLAMNISSRHLDLAAVVADTVKPLRLFVIGCNDVPDAAKAEPGRYSSFWLVLARQPSDMGELLRAEGWFAPEQRNPPRPWTDDFADVLSVFRWR